MGQAWKLSQKHKRPDAASITGNEDFELHADDVWDDNHMGRFAKARWSEGPKRRRSQWLRERLMDAAAQTPVDELGYLDLRA